MSDFENVLIPGVTPGLLPEGFVFRCDQEGCMTVVTDGPTCDQHAKPADDATVALTMSPEAAKRFWTALIYAANRIPRESRSSPTEEMSHEDWLRWGASRLDAAGRELGFELFKKSIPGRHNRPAATLPDPQVQTN